MKIVCEACGAKYSIADDRVAGKVFKIRCKRCSEVIVVRGDQPEADVAQPAAKAAYDEQSAIWHVVVDGEQAGPYAPQQLGEMLTAGTVDWEAYVWAEGFDNWVPMRDVPDLVSQITGQDAPRAAAAEPAFRAASSATLTGQPSMGADPFADDRDGGGYGGGQQSVAGPDLFAASQEVASPFSASSSRQDAGVVASAPSPRMSAERVMTGARNENSVLFSLKNLQALATGSPSVPPQSSSGPDRGGFAGGEGSGLIDIRALATTTGVGGGEGGGARDELLSIGTQGGAFGALGSPMLGGGAGDDSGSDKKTYVWAAVAAVGLLAAAGVAIAFILIRPAATTQAPPVAVQPAAVTPVAVAPATAAPGAAAPGAQTEGERAAAEAKQKASEEGSGSRSSGEHHRKRENEEKGSAPSGSEPMASPEPKESSKPAKPSGPRSIDDLLDGALNGSGKSKTAEAPAVDSNLPKSPSRDQVMSAMNSVKGDVAACGKGGPGGVAIAHVSVAGASGRVTSATISGVTGPAGSCIAQAVRKAQFPKFQSGVFKVDFPFKL
jgi:predicted Zn finger-like uncharacterized protein